MNLVIVNTEPRLHELPNVHAKFDPDTRVVTQEGHQAFRLLPGENNVPSEYWAIVKSNPGVRIALATGSIRNTGEGTASVTLASLDKISASAAMTHIGNCENVQVLSDWKANTQNIALRKAIEERVLELIASADGSAPAPQVDGDNVDPVIEAALED